MPDFSRSYTSRWQLVKVDIETWDDAEVVKGVTSAKINRDCTDNVPLLETGTFSLATDVEESLEEGWHRLVLTTVQNGVFERCPISTLLIQKTEDVVDYGRSQATYNGYSVLKPAEERKNIGDDYRYVPKGTNGPAWVTKLLRSVIPAPVFMTGEGFTVDDPIVFAPGDSYLKMVWTVLSKKKWVMRIDGSGVVLVEELPSEPSFDLDKASARYFRNEVKRSLSYEGVPNRYFAIDRDGSREIATNTLQGSRTSYQARGRWIDYVDTSPTKVNGETLYSYSRRRLEEESTLMLSYSYSRAYVDGLLPFDLIGAKLPQYGMDGDLRILSQAITCEESITVDETAALEVKEWTA